LQVTRGNEFCGRFCGLAATRPSFSKRPAALKGTFYNNAFPLLTNPSSLSGTLIDPHPKRNYVAQWNLNVQREITTNHAVLVGYVGSRGVHQQFRVDDADMNLPTLTPYGYLFPLNPPQPVLNPNFAGIRSGFLGRGKLGIEFWNESGPTPAELLSRLFPQVNDPWNCTPCRIRFVADVTRASYEEFEFPERGRAITL
jgi:hypothetical protein